VPKVNNAERVTNIIERKPVDYIPSQINFTDYTRENEIMKALGLEEGQSLDAYLQNCLYLTFAEDDIPIFFRNFDDVMLDLQNRGYAYVDFENEIVYDRLGMGTKMHFDSFFVEYSPLEGNAEKDKKAGNFLPESFTKLFGLPLEEKIKKLELPDGASDGCLDMMLNDFARITDGSEFVMPCGYFGVYERAYGLVGWEQFMLEIADRPNMMHELLEKMTVYKVQQAKKKIAETPSIIHHYGDDLGTQISGLFSLKMFREMIKPYMKEVFSVYKDAGLKVCLHCCGYIMDYIPDLIEIGLDMLEPIQTCNDIATLKREYGKDLIFWGGVETQKLPFLTPEGVKEMTKNVIHTLGKGGGLIIGPSQHVTCDVPIANIKAMVETVMEERDKVF